MEDFAAFCTAQSMSITPPNVAHSMDAPTVTVVIEQRYSPRQANAISLRTDFSRILPYNKQEIKGLAESESCVHLQAIYSLKATVFAYRWSDHN